MMQLGALQKPDKLLLTYNLKDTLESPSVTVTGTLANGCTMELVSEVELKRCETEWMSHSIDLKQKDVLMVYILIENYERFNRFKISELTFKTTGAVPSTRAIDVIS